MNETKKLSKSQQGFLASIRQRHNAAFNDEIGKAIRDVVDEIGMGEELKSGKIQIQVANDYATMTVVQPPEMPKPKVPGKLKK